jgi:hypothetical protein
MSSGFAMAKTTASTAVTAAAGSTMTKNEEDAKYQELVDDILNRPGLYRKGGPWFAEGPTALIANDGAYVNPYNADRIPTPWRWQGRLKAALKEAEAKRVAEVAAKPSFLR